MNELEYTVAEVYDFKAVMRTEPHEITVPEGVLVHGRRLGTDDRGEMIRVLADCQVDEARLTSDGSYYYRLGRMEYLVPAALVRTHRPEERPALHGSGVAHPDGLVALLGAV